MSGDRKKIPDEGTTAPDARPEVRPNSGLFQPGPNSTVFDEHASEDALKRAVSDQVLSQAETDPLAARAEDPRPRPSAPVDIGPSGTDATHLNLESALDDTRPSPMVNRHELEAQLARQGVKLDARVGTVDGTVAGNLGPDTPVPVPRPIEPFDTTAPGGLDGELPSQAPQQAPKAPPKMAQTLTFVPEMPRADVPTARRQRGVPKEESLLERIGLPAGVGEPEASRWPGRPGLLAFVMSSPAHMAAGVFAILAVLLLLTVVVVKLRQSEAPAIMSRPLEAPAATE